LIVTGTVSPAFWGATVPSTGGALVPTLVGLGAGLPGLEVAVAAGLVATAVCCGVGEGSSLSSLPEQATRLRVQRRGRARISFNMD
jgi:hypothetical protein